MTSETCAHKRRPRLLDLFCCEGGAAMGYHRAGFDVIGVDRISQPGYPFPMVVADALRPPFRLEMFDAIHASPPCQAFTNASNKHRQRLRLFDLHEDLLTPTLEMLSSLNVPWVVENVVGARRAMPDHSILLRGGMFGLRVDRPRLFASNVDLGTPPKNEQVNNPIGVYGNAPDGRWLYKRKDGTEQYAASSVQEARDAMQMPWASWRGCCEAIPPAFTEWIGKRLL